MAKAKKTKSKVQELDSIYLLKLVLYLIVGAQWIWVVNTSGDTRLPIPFGLIIGILFASRDHFQIDRKIEFAVLLVATFLGYAVQSGIFITH
jgi:hypothetical protein